MRKLRTLLFIFSILTILTVEGRVRRQVSTGVNNPSCGQKSLSVLGNLEVADLKDITSCGDYPEKDPIKYCDCLSERFDKTISESQEYKDFEKKVIAFDRQESRVEIYTNKSDTMILAALANLIGGADKKSGSSPILENEACSKQFSDLEGRLNKENSGHPFNADALKSILASQRDYDTLTTLGIGPNAINDFLANYWTVQRPEVGTEGPSAVSHPADFEKNAKNIFFEAMSYYGGGKELTKLQVKAIAQNKVNGSHIPLSASDALPAICESLAKRFESSYSAREVPIPTGDLLDITGYISEKELTSADMGSFSGLINRYLSRRQGKSYEEYYEEVSLYFGQMMCSSLNRETFGPIKGSDELVIKALTEDELISKINVNNSYLRQVVGEYEALFENETLDQMYMNKAEKELKALLSEAGISLFRLESLSETTPEELDAIKENLLKGQVVTEELKAKILTKVSVLYELTRKHDKSFDDLGVLNVSMADRQTKNNELFRELSSRVGGVVAAQSKIEGGHSSSSSYFARFDNDSNFQGPMPSAAILLTGDQRRDSIQEKLDVERRDQANIREAISDIADSDYISEEDKLRLRKIEESIREGAFSRRSISRFSGDIDGYRGVRLASDDRGESPIKDTESSFLENNRGGDSDPLNALGVRRSSANLQRADDRFSKDPRGLLDEGLTVRGGFEGATASVLSDSPAVLKPGKRIKRKDRPSRRPIDEGDKLDSSIESIVSRIDNKLEKADSSEEGVKSSIYRNQLADAGSELKSLQEERDRLNEKLRIAKSGAASISDVSSNSIASSIVTPVKGVFSGTAGGGSSSVRTSSEDISSVRVAPTVSAAPPSRGEEVARESSEVASASSSSVVPTRNTSVGTTQAGGYGTSFQLEFSELESIAEGVDVDRIEIDFLSLSEDRKEEFMNSYFSQFDGEVAYVQQADGRIVLLKKRNLERSPAGQSIADAKESDEEAKSRITKRVRELNLLIGNIL